VCGALPIGTACLFFFNPKATLVPNEGVRLKRNRLRADEEECDATPQGVVPLLNEGRLSRAALNP